MTSPGCAPLGTTSAPRPGPGGTYRLVTGVKIPPLLLDADEVCTLATGLLVLEAGGADASAAVVREGIWYLIAYDTQRADWRLFRLDRVQDAASQAAPLDATMPDLETWNRAATLLIGHPSSTTSWATLRRWRGVNAALACDTDPSTGSGSRRWKTFSGAWDDACAVSGPLAA